MAQTIPCPETTSTGKRSRDEIIQHMDAFLYLYDRVVVVVQSRLLSERLILNAHKKMMNCLVEGVGRYRNFPVYVENHQFLPEDYVLGAMAALITNYHAQLKQLKEEP
jgi:hypothetical protein